MGERSHVEIETSVTAFGAAADMRPLPRKHPEGTEQKHSGC
jgi:hypothetical protein